MHTVSAARLTYLLDAAMDESPGLGMLAAKSTVNPACPRDLITLKAVGQYLVTTTVVLGLLGSVFISAIGLLCQGICLSNAYILIQ